MNENQQRKVYFITGASGVGKTTLVKQLKTKYGARPWAFLHFDSIGVPSLLEMKEVYGSGSEWQRASVLKWIDKITHLYDNEKVFIEGQVDLEFIRSAFAEHQFSNYEIILMHCNEDEMCHRLTYNRGQPELFDQHMKNWLNFLKSQAEEMGIAIIDTTDLSEEEGLASFEEMFKL